MNLGRDWQAFSYPAGTDRRWDVRASDVDEPSDDPSDHYSIFDSGLGEAECRLIAAAPRMQAAIEAYLEMLLMPSFAESMVAADAAVQGLREAYEHSLPQPAAEATA